MDSSRFPLVILRLPRVIDVPTIDALAREQARIFERERNFVSLVDLRQVGTVPAPIVRQKLGEWAKSIESRSKLYQLANAIVIENPIIRAALSAVHWIAPPPVPTKVVGSLEEGLAFLRGHLERAGIPSAFAGL